MCVGFFRRLHTSSVPEVRQLVQYCMSDMRTTTARNITRICKELSLDVNTATPWEVRKAWQLRPMLPDDEWKLETLGNMVEEWLDIKGAGQGVEEWREVLFEYIHVLCVM